MKDIIKKNGPQFVVDFGYRYFGMRNNGLFAERPVTNFFKLLRWSAHELTGNDVSFTCPDGTRYVSMPRNYSSFSVYLLNHPDPDVYAYLRKNLPKGATLLDIGANIGTYAIPAGRIVGDAGRVIAIEAHPFNFEYLKKNIALSCLKNILPINIALGPEKGHIEMAYKTANAGETHVATKEEKSISVPVIPLDDLLREQRIGKIDYMKIDVEGFELSVLSGATETIRNNPRIVIQTELIERHAERYGNSMRDIVALLSSFELVPHRVDEYGDPSVIESFDTSEEYEVLWWRDASKLRTQD